MILPRDRPILADGAMATNLFSKGLRLGDPPELWAVTHPATIVALHRDFIAAGAELILSNSFGGHPHRLGASGLADRVSELNAASAHLARAAADQADRPVRVAGAVGPTGDAVPPNGAAEGFRRQMRALAEGGADLIWIETMSYPAEICIAAEAAADTGLPYGLTASFGPDGRTLGGLDAVAFARLALDLPVRPILLGANCGSGVAALLDDLAKIRRIAPGLPLVAKPSAGLPTITAGRLAYPLSPADLARDAAKALALGVRVIGGCCGTTPAHVAAMRDALAVASPAKAF